MKKTNVISIRLSDEEINKLQSYSTLFNTDKPGSIIKGLLTMNPYFEILKETIEDLDNKEAKLMLLQLEFPKDKDVKKIIDNKIEYLDQIRTDILRKIDDRFTCIGIAHNLSPKNSMYIDELDFFKEDNHITKSNEDKKFIDSEDDLDFIKFDELVDDSYEGLDGDELIKKIEEEDRIECKKMKDRAREYLRYL